MLFNSIFDFFENTPPLPHRLMGLDIGEKTIGVAVSNSGCTLASPLKTVTYKKITGALPELKKIKEDYGVQSLVIGYPLNMDGSEGDRCDFIKKIAAELASALSMSAMLWDERMSTVSAERTLIDLDMSRNKRKKNIDAHAASIILQSFLDRLSNTPKA